MKDRSQSINRFLARRELLERIENLTGKATDRIIEIGKIRKQKMRRRKKTKIKYEASP